jgi:hypothetical protein
VTSEASAKHKHNANGQAIQTGKKEQEHSWFSQDKTGKRKDLLEIVHIRIGVIIEKGGFRILDIFCYKNL